MDDREAEKKNYNTKASFNRVGARLESESHSGQNVSRGATSQALNMYSAYEPA